MSAFETSLVSALTSHAGLAALIGARCEPGTLPPGTALPAIVYVIVTRPLDQDAAGAIIGSRYHVQISALAETVAGGAGGYAVAGAVIEQVQLALLAFAGTTYEITGLSERDVDTPDPETGLYQRSIDATFDTTPPATVTIWQTDIPAASVVVYDPIEDIPRTPRSLAPTFLVNGDLVIYEVQAGLQTLSVRGTLLTPTPAERLRAWAEAGDLLSFTDRAGVITTGWRVRPDIFPTTRHAPEGTDWTVAVQLWRIP